jgi:farnesyl diphosphate synthase
VIGKIGRDIEENKCSWLVVQAIQSCSTEQRDLLEKHYGRDNADDVAVVKVMSQLREFFMNIRS